MAKEYLQTISREIRKDILKMHSEVDASHIASSFSCVDILVALYFKIMRINPKNQNWCDRDRFILSKGHAASALYAVLAKKKLFNPVLLKNYCRSKAALPGHVTKNSLPFIEVSTGSLGHGLSIGAGMAFAAKYDKLKHRIFVLLSDGECNEGSIWEAILFSSHHRLDNLVAIIDYNKLQAFGRTEEVLNLEPFKDKWASFGWEPREVDGHDCEKIASVLSNIPFRQDKPNVIIAHTIKGKGVSFMEDNLIWHYKSPQGDDFKNASKELGA